MVKPRVDGETKEEKFKRIAENRTANILENLRKLGNCSNKSVYTYTTKDLNKIFSAIDRETKRVKAMFDKPVEKFEL